MFAHHSGQQLGDGPGPFAFLLDPLAQPVHLGDQRLAALQQRGHQQVVDAREVVGDRRRRHLGLAGDVAVADRTHAVAGHDPQRRVDDRAAAAFALGPAAVGLRVIESVVRSDQCVPPSSSAMTPPMMSATPPTWTAVIVSPRNTTPMIATSATPAPAQIA